MPTTAVAPAAPGCPSDWRALLRDAIRDPAELFAMLDLGAEDIAALGPAASDFPLLVPRGFAARMRPRTPNDPLLRQVLPVERERERVPGFALDPLGERRVAAAGVLRKYPGRALLIATAACPVHCRYCFRRHFPYDAQTAGRGEWRPALAALARARDVTEVILSGGDPLCLSNRRLAGLLAGLDALEHVTTLRIHSRFPVVLPERIDAGLLGLLGDTRLRTVMVVHCNHAQEIDTTVEAALLDLRASGATVLNQSVLLSGVNDDLDVLQTLSRRLFAAGVLPYYLHELDAVAGAAHFAVTRVRARELVEGLRESLPGYLVPRLVRETPGELSKTVIA